MMTESEQSKHEEQQPVGEAAKPVTDLVVHTGPFPQMEHSSGTSSSPSMTVMLFFGLVAFLLWAALFEIDQSVRAQGQLIPSGRTQVIQAADGGVLAELLVGEGERVTAGQTLAIFEKERANASYEESRVKVASFLAALVRAKAECNGEAPVFGPVFDDFPDIVEVERELYEQRKRSLNDELDTLKDSLEIAQEELNMNLSLFETGDISRVDVMRTQRQVTELNGKLMAVKNKYLQESRKEASKLETDLASARHKLDERQSVLGHTELLAPVDGIVKYLRINTLGGVLRAGDELMQISPTDVDLVVEARINPVDIGQLSLGLPVSIKLDAFDYSIYGAIEGTLSYISSDTLEERGGNGNGQLSTYYRAHIKVDADKRNQNPKLANEPLKPGMTATVDIKTNSRSVLRYLAKPVFKAFSGAMNER